MRGTYTRKRPPPPHTLRLGDPFKLRLALDVAHFLHCLKTPTSGLGGRLGRKLVADDALSECA